MPPDQATREPGSDAPASQLVQVSHVMARIYEEQLGRGPDRVHSHYAGPGSGLTQRRARCWKRS
jgi:hypothetical protein